MLKVGFVTPAPEFDHGIALKGTLTRRLDFPAQMMAPRVLPLMSTRY